MDSSWVEMREQFIRLMTQPEEAQPVALEKSGVDDPDMASELASLLECSRSIERTQTLDGFHDRLTARPVASRIPDKIGRYEIVDLLGEGGMGRVYLAWHPGLERDVALKVIRVGEHAFEREKAQFTAEARAMAQLQHPGIVPVYDFGEHDNQLFFTMAVIAGESLAEAVAERPLEPRTCAELMVQVAEALAYAHGKGVVHRDIKPGNILLDQHHAKITDFGLAKQHGPDESYRSASGAQIAGTPAYMAPEQTLGKIQPSIDVYALGATLYHLLVGHPPFQAATVWATLQQVRDQEPIPPRRHNSHIPRDLETIVLGCLEKDPDRRYRTAEAVAKDLRQFLDRKPISRRATSRIERARRWTFRHWRTVVPAALVLIATLVAIIVAWQLETANLEREAAREQARSEGLERQKAEAEGETARELAKRREQEARLAEVERKAAEERERNADEQHRLERASLLRSQRRERRLADLLSWVTRKAEGLDTDLLKTEGNVGMVAQAVRIRLELPPGADAGPAYLSPNHYNTRCPGVQTPDLRIGPAFRCRPLPERIPLVFQPLLPVSLTHTSFKLFDAGNTSLGMSIGARHRLLVHNWQRLQRLTGIVSEQRMALLGRDDWSPEADLEILNGATAVVWSYFSLHCGIHCSYPGNGGHLPTYDPTERPWYTRAWESVEGKKGFPVWSDRYDDAAGQGPLIACCRQIQNPDPSRDPLGVAAVDFRIQWLIDRLGTDGVQGVVRVTLAARHRGKDGVERVVKLADSIEKTKGLLPEDPAKRRFNVLEVERRILDGVREFGTVDVGDRVYVLRPLHASGWWLVIEVDREKALGK